ncbi:hypothetical protein BUE76_03190 [Cnuella takakiae]|nr:hypothetical protein BUE76_03190 [Cnuella takakiae]
MGITPLQLGNACWQDTWNLSSLPVQQISNKFEFSFKFFCPSFVYFCKLPWPHRGSFGMAVTCFYKT